MLVSGVLTLIILGAMAGPAMAELRAASQSAQPDIEAMSAAWQKMTPAYLVTMLVSMVFAGVLNASAARMVLRPQAGGPIGHVRFGADEVRQIILVLIFNLILLGVAVAAGVFVGLLIAIGGVTGGFLGGLLAFVIGIPTMVLVSIRLSLATALTFETERIALGEAWRLTTGHFWNLFVAFLIAWIMAIIVAMLGLAVSLGVVAVVFGFEGVGQATAPAMTSIGSLFNAPLVVYQVLMSGFAALFYINVLTPGPAIYAQLKGQTTVFD